MRNATIIATAIACSSQSVPATAKNAKLATSTKSDRHPPQPRQLKPPSSGPRSIIAADARPGLAVEPLELVEQRGDDPELASYLRIEERELERAG